ncbi:MAG: cell division protein FtsZ [Nanoarchaeota archaeon]
MDKLELVIEEQEQELKNNLDEVDRELEKYIALQKARVRVFGAGGGGNNTIARMREIGIKGCELVAVNTDAQDLLYTNADSKILIGKELTLGLGAGSDPKIGEDAARENEQDIRKKMAGSNLVFVTCGLGGGTGTGSAPVIAEVAKKSGALTIAIVTLPFTIEGQRRYQNAMQGIERLEKNVDTLIVIPNDKLLELAPDLPLQTAFKVADEILTNAVKGITELITKPGLVNLDFADVKAIMGKGGVAMIGVGESDGKDRSRDAVEKALNNPLLDVEIEGATGGLVNIVGGKDMSLEEAKTVIDIVNEKMGDNANLIWGASVSEEMEKLLRVMVIMTGLKSPQILGPEEKKLEKDKLKIREELGIEFFK